MTLVTFYRWLNMPLVAYVGCYDIGHLWRWLLTVFDIGRLLRWSFVTYLKFICCYGCHTLVTLTFVIYKAWRIMMSFL